MPRKYRRVKLAHRELSWADISISEMLHFWVGFRPRDHGPWQTWAEYLGDWAAVRDEGLADWAERRARMRADCEAEVARRRARLPEGVTDSDRSLYAELLERAEANLAREAAKDLPAAEIAYQRVLAGGAPDGRDSSWAPSAQED